MPLAAMQSVSDGRYFVYFSLNQMEHLEICCSGFGFGSLSPIQLVSPIIHCALHVSCFSLTRCMLSSTQPKQLPKLSFQVQNINRTIFNPLIVACRVFFSFGLKIWTIIATCTRYYSPDSKLHFKRNAFKVNAHWINGKTFTHFMNQ